MPFTADETTACASLTNDLSGTRARCSHSPIKWCRGVIVRGGVVVYETRSCFSGADEARYPRWVRDYATNDKSTRDAEVKVLVDLEYANPQPNDVVVLYGDDGPCSSCRSVIRQWSTYYRQHGAAGLLTTVIYTVAAYQQKNGIWPKGCLYGHGNPITDVQGKYYYRP
jgi:hypothetical protein